MGYIDNPENQRFMFDVTLPTLVLIFPAVQLSLLLLLDAHQ